jgi:hypothetical protein
MSSISNNLALSNLAQSFQLASFTNTTLPTQSIDPTQSTSSATSIDPSQTSGQSVQGMHHHHRGGGGGGGEDGKMFQQIQSAVTSALQSAGSNTSADANSVVENAIASVFKNALNGGTAGTQTTNTATEPDEADTPETSDTDASSSTQQGFASFLQQYGIDPQQFRDDFTAAVQSVQNGNQADPSSVFGSFPPGLIVDQKA